MSDAWFSTSKDGLALQAKERGAAYVFTELIVNSIDERFSGCNEIRVDVAPIPSKAKIAFFVEDNSPRGYGEFLDHAYTLFAPSYKRGNPEQNGQFNFGCKLALSLCDHARIISTTGGIEFPENGPFRKLRRKTEIGSRFEGQMAMTREELSSLEDLLHSLLLPEGITLIYNEEIVPIRKPFAEFTVTLPTKVPNNDGVMTRTERNVPVRVYEILDGESPYIYELGVPVVESDFRWHVSVGQKVLLTKDRDNVTPAYKRRLCTAVAEHLTELINAEDASKWGGVVLEDSNASIETVNKILNEAEGENRVVWDMHDRDANNTAVNSGATVIPPSRYSKKQWENIRRTGSTPTAGVKFPSPKPYDENGKPAVIIPREDWTPGMVGVERYVSWLVREVFGANLRVVMVERMSGNTAAAWQKGDFPEIHFAVHTLGKKWFIRWHDGVDELIIHEMAHQYVDDHHAKGKNGWFYDACCKVGRQLIELALDKPKEMNSKRGW